MKSIYDLTASELKEELVRMGEKEYRAGQIFSWLHAKGVSHLDGMTDISRDLKGRLAERFSDRGISVSKCQESALDGTRKYLFELEDATLIEGVFMQYRDWNTSCISSQAGCAMGCRFCASTVGGLKRDMTAGEMAQEIYAMERDTGSRVSHVVVMGSGEPLLNYDNLMRFLDIITDSRGKGLSQRNITVSTCGIVPGIEALAREKRGREHLQINLAISLHAAFDEKRKKIMPIAERYGISEVLDAARKYYDATHRRITIEYALIDGVNDTDEDAAELARILKKTFFTSSSGSLPLINLIPVNPVTESGFKRPDRAGCLAFKNKLENFGINGSIRRELGSDIDGACGQLRLKSLRA